MQISGTCFRHYDSCCKKGNFKIKAHTQASYSIYWGYFWNATLEVATFRLFQVQDKFRLDLSDEEAVHYMQSLIDESVGALFAAVVEQIHKFAQVRSLTLQRTHCKKSFHCD